MRYAILPIILIVRTGAHELCAPRPHSSAAWGNERDEMAKKSTATRQTPAARRSQTTVKAAEVMLVRTAKATDSTAPAPANAKPAATAKPTGVSQQERPRALEAPRAARPTAPRREPPAHTAPKAQASRVARARVTQRARTANLVTP